MALIDEVKEVVLTFPTLSWRAGAGEFVIEGSLPLEHDGTSFDDYMIELHVPHAFPSEEPKLFEVGGRIERTLELHVNTDGSACYEVFEYWLTTIRQPSVLAFVKGPVVNFFLSQTIHEITGEWEFGERSHGLAGLIEAAAEAVGAKGDMDKAATRLRVLRDWPAKGHHACPCDSALPFRNCHREELMEVHQRMPPALAQRLVGRILKYADAEKAKAERAKQEAQKEPDAA